MSEARDRKSILLFRAFPSFCFIGLNMFIPLLSVVSFLFCLPFAFSFFYPLPRTWSTGNATSSLTRTQFGSFHFVSFWLIAFLSFFFFCVFYLFLGAFRLLLFDLFLSIVFHVFFSGSLLYLSISVFTVMFFRFLFHLISVIFICLCVLVCMSVCVFFIFARVYVFFFHFVHFCRCFFLSVHLWYTLSASDLCSKLNDKFTWWQKRNT